MAQRFAQPFIRTSVLISPEFYELCKTYKIKFSEAMKIGISLSLAEKGVKEYDNNLNISRKILKITERLNQTSQELNDLKENEKT